MTTEERRISKLRTALQRIAAKAEEGIRTTDGLYRDLYWCCDEAVNSLAVDKEVRDGKG